MVSRVLGVYKLLSQQRFVYKLLGHDAEEMEPYPDELEMDHCLSSVVYDDLVSEVKFYRVFIKSAQFLSICYGAYVYISMQHIQTVAMTHFYNKI